MSLGIRQCLNCFENIVLKITRDLERKKFCSHSCRQLHYCKNDIRYKNNLELARLTCNTPEANKKKGRSGPLNGRYKLNRSLVKCARKAYESSEWRKQVFKRDNYTCVICRVRGGKLNADHIKPWSIYPEFRFDINNGRTLCVPCHKTTDTYGSKVWKYKDCK